MWGLHLLIGSLFLFGIVAGVTLVESRRWGVLLSAIYQALQILYVATPFLVYRFYSGFQIGFG